MQHTIFIVVSIVLILVGIGIQVGLGMIYHNMIMETDNMTSTDNKLLKQCKLKFWNCYQSNGGVNNIPIFVEKFLNRIKLGKCSAITLQHLSGQLVLLSVFTSGVGIYLGITGGQGLLGLLPFYIISMLGLYLFFSVSSAVDIAGKKKILKTNIVDYLENHMLERMKYVSRKERNRDGEDMVQWAMSQSSVRAPQKEAFSVRGRFGNMVDSKVQYHMGNAADMETPERYRAGNASDMETERHHAGNASDMEIPERYHAGNASDMEMAGKNSSDMQNDVASRCAQFVQNVENSYEGITAEELQELLSQFFATEE
ncbi:MAG: hypothetical protein ACI4DU_09895 [Lachnospiraceae bacterium]